MNIPAPLKVRMAGLPRWVWLGGLGGGIAIGLYIRSRRRVEEPVVEEETGTGAPYTGADIFEPAYAGGVGAYMGGDGSSYQETLDASFERAQTIADWYRQGLSEGIVIGGSAVVAPPVVDTGWISDALNQLNQTIAGIGGGGVPAMPEHQLPQVQSPAPAPAPRQTPQQQRQEEEKRQAEARIRMRVDEAMSVRTDPRGRYRGRLAVTAAGRTRDRVETSARRHPNWGPYTLAWGRRLDGHSEGY